MSHPRIVVAPAGATAAAQAEILDRATRRGFLRLALPIGADPPKVPGLVVDRLAEDALETGGPGGVRRYPLQRVSRPDDLQAAMAAGRRAGGVLIAWTSERVIPLENLIADARGNYEVAVLVDRFADLPAMLGALEHGADRVIVRVASPELVDQLEAALGSTSLPAVDWELLPLVEARSGGLGDRVIVDTTSMLAPEEGMLLGSVAAYLFHVRSEAVGSRYTRPRPFRVNAGAAHMYALLADGSTRYLAELVAGDAVLVARPNGPARAVRVGRIKIERRPFCHVAVERGGRRYTAFLQEAETVRLSGPDSGVATTELSVGTRVYGAPFAPARHLGTVVDETIDER